MKESAATLLLLLCMCSVAFGQTPDAAPGAPDLPEIRQVAKITLLGDRGVEVERQEGDEAKTVVLAGPYVTIEGLPGEAFAVDDLNSPGVGGLLGEGATVTFAGDFELTFEPLHSGESEAANTRITVYNALIEIHTEEVEELSGQGRAGSSDEYERPLNQTAEYIRALRDKVKASRIPERH